MYVRHNLLSVSEIKRKAKTKLKNVRKIKKPSVIYDIPITNYLVILLLSKKLGDPCRRGIEGDRLRELAVDELDDERRLLNDERLPERDLDLDLDLDLERLRERLLSEEWLCFEL